MILDFFKKRFARWDRRHLLSKRQEFVFVTLILTGILILTQNVSLELRYPFIVFLSLVAYGLTAFALREDLHGIEWFTILILPMLFTAAVALFYFLLPVRWLTRLPIAFLYGVGMYALILTENIFNVAVDRTIALLRAAHSVGFLLTLLTFFLLSQAVLAFRFFPIINVILIAIICFALVVSSLWSIELTPTVSRRVWQLSIAITVSLVNIVFIFSLLPTRAPIQALFFTTVLYSGLGMGQQYLVERLYKKNVIEFMIVSAIVFCIAIISTSWRGNL